MLGWEGDVEWGTWDENEDDSATVLTADASSYFSGYTPELCMAKLTPLMFMTMGHADGIAQVVQGWMIQL